jgi:hypothetical protein
VHKYTSKEERKGAGRQSKQGTLERTYRWRMEEPTKSAATGIGVEAEATISGGGGREEPRQFLERGWTEEEVNAEGTGRRRSVPLYLFAWVPCS